MLRLKIFNRGLSNFLIVGLLISSPGNAAQTGTGSVRGSHDSSGQNAGGGSFLPNNVTNDVPLPHYCTTTGTNNSQGTWLDTGVACCGTTGGAGAQNGGCASCSGSDNITNGVWIISTTTGWSTVNNASVTAGAQCCGTGANATNAACLPYCSIGPDGPTGSGINTQTSASCCGSQSFLVPAPGGTAVAGACANDVNCLGSVQAQGLSGTWAGGTNVGQTCCGSGTILSGGASNGVCTPVCSGTASTSGTWSNGTGACCGSGTSATSGACAPTCNGTTWSDNSGQCCGSGTAAQGATSGACSGSLSCVGGQWFPGGGACCGTGTGATNGGCGCTGPACNTTPIAITTGLAYPAGAWCGSYTQDRIYGNINLIPCNGADISKGCPAGYSYQHYVQGDGDNAWTCVGTSPVLANLMSGTLCGSIDNDRLYCRLHYIPCLGSQPQPTENDPCGPGAGGGCPAGSTNIKYFQADNDWAHGCVFSSPPSTVPSGTFCGAEATDAPANGHSLSGFPCNGMPLTGGICPAGYTYTGFFQASNQYNFTCVKN